MKEPIPSGGGAMPETTRRTFIAGTAASIAVVAAPLRAEAAEPEHPWKKARRIANELSEALAEGDGCFTGPGGKWNAQIYPAGHSDYPIGFGNISAHEWPRQNVTLPCQKVIDAHREAREALPHIRPGEFVVVDTNDTMPRDGEVYVIQWQSGQRCICQAHNMRRKAVERPEEDAWSVSSLKAIRGRAAIDAYLNAASVIAFQTGVTPTLTGLGWSDGWLSAEHLEEKFVGCVIGLYAASFEGPKLIDRRIA